MADCFFYIAYLGTTGICLWLPVFFFNITYLEITGISLWLPVFLFFTSPVLEQLIHICGHCFL